MVQFLFRILYIIDYIKIKKYGFTYNEPCIFFIAPKFFRFFLFCVA
jgi:hypothetical protein